MLLFGRRSVLAVATAIGVAGWVSAASACGFHSPQHYARGFLNWTYPKALYVGTAVWQAEEAGLLPARERRIARNLFGYNAAVGDLRRMGEDLGEPDDGAEVSFSVVLIDSVMWSRFDRDAVGYAVIPHVDGPAPENPVVVTHSKVVSALADGTLGGEDAVRHGLVRLYGPQGEQERLAALLKSAFPAVRSSLVADPSAMPE